MEMLKKYSNFARFFNKKIRLLLCIIQLTLILPV